MILARFGRVLILGSALTLGVGLASWQNSALAGVSRLREGCPLFDK